MRNRVSVLANLYETLQGEDSPDVSLEQLIKRVCTSLSHAFSSGANLKLTFEAQPITMGSRSASAFGLVLNELITNAFKHAFPDNRPGRIDVSLIREKDNAILMVEDDGIGFDHSAKQREEGHFGFELIDTLVEQLGGSFRFEGVSGTRAIVTIPL